MKINDDHMYQGAGLTQIAEHDLFTSINAVKVSGKLSRSAFKVNDTIGVFIKYAKKPTNADYCFTFTKANKEELENLDKVCDTVFLALACIQDREFCCLSLQDLKKWLDKRETALQGSEDTSTILVQLPQGKAFRVNMNQPGKKGLYLDKPQIIPRNRFPNSLFEK